MQLDRHWIESRIPHRHRMCLLDAVVSWDAAHVVCSATSHRDTENPLRAHGRLGAACGVEYAAQAMAVHGALLASGDAPSGLGYIASVRDVAMHACRLDDVDADLAIEARRLAGDDNNILYQFSVRADGRDLLGGRAMVVLDATRLRRPAGNKA